MRCKETFYRSNAKVQIINYDLGKIEPLYNLVESGYIIKLETSDSCLIGDITDIFFWKDRIFIADGYKSKSIFLYSKDGHFLKKIRKVGKGPQEYLGINQMGINYVDNCLYILDLVSMKIIFYNYFGEFIKEEKINIYTTKVHFLRSGNELFYNGFRKNPNDECNFNLFLSDTSNHILKKSFPFIGKQNAVNKMMCFQSTEDGVDFYMPLHGDTIYSIHEDTIISKYKISFGKYSVPNDFIDNYPDVKSQMKILKNDNFYQLESFFESKDFLFFNFSSKYNFLYYGAYHKKDKSLVFGNIFDLKAGLFSDFPVTQMLDNKFVTVIDGKLKKAINNYTSLVNSLNYIKKEDKGLINNMKEDDNPLILIRYLRVN
jgi:hypothetical protein